MQGVKEYKFEGFRISGFLALSIGIALTVLCILLTVKGDLFGVLLALGLPVLQMLSSNKNLKAESQFKKYKLELGGGTKSNAKFTAFSESSLGVFITFVIIVILVASEMHFEPKVILGLLGIIAIQPILLGGLIKLEPNEAAVLIFFGRYSGTMKENGFFWVNPFYKMEKMPLRARNTTVSPMKVNDKAGNPIMIGAVLVWRIKDTYKAKFEIEVSTTQSKDIMRAAASFVETQSDAALRQIAGMYKYDNEEGDITLRSANKEIDIQLEKELNSRLAIAGVEILEARINYLAYAPEIAKVMLRRQQAEAIVSAREKIVDGAVGMVEMALAKLQKENLVKFDQHRRSVMVSNLLAILCTDDGVHST